MEAQNFNINTSKVLVLISIIVILAILKYLSLLFISDCVSNNIKVIALILAASGGIKLVGMIFKSVVKIIEFR